MYSPSILLNGLKRIKKYHSEFETTKVMPPLKVSLRSSGVEH
jgi:hypothetical protein